MFLKNVPITGIQFCTYLITPEKETVNNAGRLTHGLACFFDGDNDFIYKDGVIHAKSDCILYLPQGRSYTVVRRSAAKCAYVGFHTASECNDPPFAKSYRSFAQFKELFHQMISVYQKKRPGYEAESMAVLYRIIAAIQAADSSSYSPQSYYKMLAPAIDSINRNYAGGKLRISELADLCGISTRYFSKLFSDCFGCPPKEYILKMQIDDAKNRLVSLDATLGEIGEACGLGDVYYFSKMFKKSTGLSPTEYRNANRML